MNGFFCKLARNEDEKLLIARLHSLAVRASQGTAGQSDFLDLRQQELARLNISSLRLDAAVAAVFNLSRSQVGAYIESGETRINHLEVGKPSAAIKAGDLISVRGLGRFRLEEVGGLSRKGRQFVTVSRW